jgi:hypothetical protein
MTDLMEFLRARLAEDASLAQQAIDTPARDVELYATWPRQRVPFGMTFDPARTLREVEAKRLILEEHANDGGYCRRCMAEDRQENTLEEIRNDGPYMITVHRPLLYPCPTLRLLALSYADHEDYREEWRYQNS